MTAADECPESAADVSIVANENKRIITSAVDNWDDWFDNPLVSYDFMVHCEQAVENKYPSGVDP